ncbi:Protein PsiE [Ferriphaselus amnicola]|uniref:Protein PsiE n=1 Tax=Ferriphaselus amnicola TaxID=1188319 RepID=A0A2Z6GBY3_9PROT|nr:phosphate-starvation-inducible PsiE family protein [Ferriphaselus amnicola]BBE50986.1 Protein PsiE [Ferriphaselus amnicola]
MKKYFTRGVVDMSNSVISAIEFVGLIVIAVGTVIAMGQHIWQMHGTGSASLGDLLLMFLYLEILLMVRHYLSSGKFPVRYHLYIGIVALARYIIIDIKEMDAVRLLEISVAVLILSMAVLLVRYGHTRFPPGSDDHQK